MKLLKHTFTRSEFDSRTRGSAAIEFVLILPIFLIIFFSMIEYGRYFYARVLMSNASIEVASAISRGVFATGSSPISGTDGTVSDYVNKIVAPSIQKVAGLNSSTPVVVNVFQNPTNGLTSPLSSTDIKLACSSTMSSGTPALISVEISTKFTPLTKPLDQLGLPIFFPSTVISKATQRCLR